MALSVTEDATITRLSSRLNTALGRRGPIIPYLQGQPFRPSMLQYQDYYESTQLMSYMRPEHLLALGDRIRPVRLGWPAITVDRIRERLSVEGFRYGTDADADSELWDIWQASNMDLASDEAHREALLYGRAFIIGSVMPDGSPQLRTVSPLEMTVAWDRDERVALAGWRTWIDDGDGSTRGRLWLPGRSVDVRRTQKGWTEDTRNTYTAGTVPIEVLGNHVSASFPLGRSELTPPILDLTDAAIKLLTDMMVGAENHAVARRVVMGVSTEDITDQYGEPVDPGSALMGDLTVLPDADSSVTEFSPSSLTNFIDAVTALAMRFSAEAAVPPQYVGVSSLNPTSADAIRAMEAALIERAQSRQREFGEAWERVGRMALRILHGVAPSGTENLETMWSDPGTPTKAQAADAAAKLVAAGIIPPQQAQEDLGYTSVQRERMRLYHSEAATRILGGDIAGLVGPNSAQMVAPPPSSAAAS